MEVLYKLVSQRKNIKATESADDAPALGICGEGRKEMRELLGTMLSSMLADHIGEVCLCPFPDEKLRLREEK